MPVTANPEAAIVTTLRNAGAVLDSFLRYHFAIGFAHIFLFFDDPNDPDLVRAASMPNVTAIAHDSALRERWKDLRSYAEMAPSSDREVMGRQVLNAELALTLARERGMGWLLHIDADELFYSPGESVKSHFARMGAQGFEGINYPNYEAIPEKDEIGDFFREVDLFKVQPSLWRVPLTEAGARVLQAAPQFHPNYYNFYGVGKSAANLSVANLKPKGVHFFEVAEDEVMHGLESRTQFILHYACCGFEHFWTKYATLGRFADQWWGKYDIAAMIGPFHLEARDIVASGDREAARAFYRQGAAIKNPALVAQLLQFGFVTRVTQPRRILGAF
jgi:hypothetical protein